jgi:hypothetical protein
LGVLEYWGDIKTIANHAVRTDICVLVDWWEHAWATIDYQIMKDKERYLDNIWKIIDWDVCKDLDLPSDPDDQIFNWLEDYYKKYLSYSENSELNRRKNIHAMRDICSQHQVSFYVNYLNNFHCDTDARDLMHQGPPAHAKLAQDFFEQIKVPQ